MGCKPAPMLANIWLSQFDNTIKGDGDIYFRYMDDCLADILEEEEMNQLNLINSLHPNLNFTIETVKKSSDKDDEGEIGSIIFLDMKLIQKTDGTVDSEWFTKPTDTGTVMNWNSIAPMKYKRNLVSGFVNRIWSATTTYDAFMRGCEKAKVILSKNQFPQSWIDFNFHRVIEKVHHRRSHPRDTLDKMVKS